MDIDPAKQTFLAECHELLQSMEDGLLRLETAPQDAEAVNAVFRAAHTLKGSAGLFGFDPIVGFTHVAENVLSRLRDGRLAYDPDLAALLLSCRDHIEALVDRIAAEGGAPDEGMQATGEALTARLRKYLGEGEAKPPVAAACGYCKDHTAQTPCHDGAAENDAWHISVRFGRDVLRNGMDPLAFIRYLETLGEVVGMTVIPDALPDIGAMDPESCYLGFEIDLKSEASKEAIAGVFEFVREDCTLHILPPHSRIADYIELIRKLPEDKMRLGEVLMECGALTRRELEEGLRVQAQNGAAAAPPIGEILVSKGAVPQEAVDAALERQNVIREGKARDSRLIRVQAHKLDRLIDFVGELVIAGAGAGLLAKRSGDAALHESVSSLLRLVEEIRDSALQLRTVQIGETFARFQRVVRDGARELGKEIDLVVSGAETELDKSVVEKIADPLMHLVRNAMDHGIEPAEVRRARGKPARGTLRLNACHDSGSVAIEVGDDGGGLNRERILKKAVERGLIDGGESLSDREVCNLIFEPGFSTAEKVTNLSGRGVGMDVVKRNIAALRGTVELDSREGAGTTVRIRLPLTLAIIDGFLVGAGKSSFVVPLDMVVECVELAEEDRQAASFRDYINLRGEVLPLIRLRRQFGIGGRATRRENVVVVQFGGRKAGIVVDALLGELQTVIKPLGRMFNRVQCLSGSTILGSGEIALILDVPALVQQAIAQESAAGAAA
jgi:two-component system chemotaxis sensor kinase CheA